MFSFVFFWQDFTSRFCFVVADAICSRSNQKEENKSPITTNTDTETDARILSIFDFQDIFRNGFWSRKKRSDAGSLGVPRQNLLRICWESSSARMSRRASWGSLRKREAVKGWRIVFICCSIRFLSDAAISPGSGFQLLFADFSGFFRILRYFNQEGSRSKDFFSRDPCQFWSKIFQDSGELSIDSGIY